MSWGYVAVAAATVVSAYMSKEEAKDARQEAGSAEERALAFEQEKYDDWQEVYGPLQENLSEYYINLSPDQYEVMGLEAIEEEKAASLRALNERLAQRGISDSGLAAAAELNIEMTALENRAEIRRAAPGAVAEQQLGFLQVGLGQDPSASMSQTLGQQALERSRRATAAEIAAGEASSAAISAVGTALSEYAGDDEDKG